MTGREFLNEVTHSKGDILLLFLDILHSQKIPFCVIGGLAVNAYAEPVVSLDMDIVIASDKLDALMGSLKGKYEIKEFSNSFNITSSQSDVRIQIQKDGRYQSFIQRAELKEVLGYKMPVASIEDVLQGKIWAYSDTERRESKRQKDLADILRLVESHPYLLNMIKEVYPDICKKRFLK